MPLPSHRALGLVQQRLDLDHLGFLALAALGTHIARTVVAAAIRSEKSFGLDERSRIDHHVEDALVERLGRDRLGEELGDACIARFQHALLFRVTGEHDDRDIGVRIGPRLADHAGQFQAVEDRHGPVGDDDVRHVVGEGLEAGRAVLRLVDLAGAEAVQKGSHDPAHVRVVVDHQESQPVEVDADHRQQLYRRGVSAPLRLMASGAELFAQDALVQRVTGIVQQDHRAGVVHGHRDGRDVAHLVVVGGGADRALGRFQHLDGHRHPVGQQRPAPAPRPEGRDRGEGEEGGIERQDRPVGREIVGRRAGRGGDEHAVGDELVHPRVPVDADPELRHLRGLAQQRHLVDGERVLPLPMDVHRRHEQRVDHRAFRVPDALDEAVLGIFVHQEPDRAAIHAIDRL
ncbi:hypothetical protein VF08_37840, partial [Nostoc linckia z8]